MIKNSCIVTCQNISTNTAFPIMALNSKPRIKCNDNGTTEQFSSALIKSIGSFFNAASFADKFNELHNNIYNCSIVLSIIGKVETCLCKDLSDNYLNLLDNDIIRFDCSSRRKILRLYF